jgi:hypothetical protein
MKGVWFRPDCYDLTRDVPAALMLSQLLYWFSPTPSGKSRLRLQHEGYYWVAKSYREWWDECRLTRRQVDRAVKLLCRLKLVEAKNFPTAKHSNIRHLRLTLDAVPASHLFLTIAAPQAKIQQNSIAPTGAMEIGVIAPTGAMESSPLHLQVHPIYTETTESTETTHITSGLSPAKAASEVDMKAADHFSLYLKKHKPESGFPPTVAIRNTLQLARWWERLVPYYHPVEWQKPLTKKEIGMLGKFRRLVPKSYEVMHWAIRHWADFLVAVAEDTGTKINAAIPQVGILLRYCAVAVSRHAASGKPSQPKQVVELN